MNRCAHFGNSSEVGDRVRVRPDASRHEALRGLQGTVLCLTRGWQTTVIVELDDLADTLLPERIFLPGDLDHA